MPPNESRFGQLGCYQLERVLARTGHSLVYRAVDVRTEQPVAVKVALPTADRSSFRKEAAMLRRLRHPGIVEALESGTRLQDGTPWFAMELVDGPSLGTVIRRQTHAHSAAPRQLTAEQVAQVVALAQSLCRALGYLHLQGIVHCDFKPDNVLLRRDGAPALLDFGAACEFGGSGRERFRVDAVIAGTAAYMAPEQIRGAIVDARVDLYALGCVLFELVCGRPPYLGSPEECVAQHLSAAVPSVHDFALGVPHEIADLIARLLEKSPKSRLGYADDVLQRLAPHGTNAPRAWYLHATEFYGQPGALTALEAALNRALHGQPGLILAAGHSGIGKTRFLLEVAQLAQRRGCAVLAAECQELASSSVPTAALDGGPLHPFGRVIEHWLEWVIEQHTLLDATHPAAALAMLFPAVAELFGDGATQVPEQAKSDAFRLRNAMVAVVRELAERGPLLVAVDDLQWADPLTIAVLRELASQPGTLPLLVVCTTRLTHRGSLIERLSAGDADRTPVVQILDLEPLSASDTAHVLSDLLGADDLPRSFAEAVFQASEGTPLLIAEVLRHAIDQGLLTRGARGEWRLAHTDMVLPPGATLVSPSWAQQRHADLGPAERSVLQAAATLGREFRVDILARIVADLAGIDDSETASALDELVRRQVVVKTDVNRFRFVHDQLRELPYAALTEAERRRIHLHAAATIEAVDSGSGYIAEPANSGLHWSRAGVHDRAAACFGRAADAAALAFANEQAVAMYEAALAELRRTIDPPALLRSRLQEGLGDVLLRIGENERAERAYREAVGCSTGTVPVRRAVLYQKAARALQNCLKASAAIEALGAAEEALTEPAKEPELYASIQIDKAWIHYWHGDLAEMERSLAKVPSEPETALGFRLRARYFEALTLAGFRRERYRVSESTVSAARQAVEAARSSGEMPLLMTSQWALGMALLFAGDLSGAQEALQETATLAGREGDVKHERSARAYMALALRLRGDVSGVLRDCEALLATAPGGLLAVWTALSCANLGWAELRRGGLAPARDFLTRASEFWRSMPSPYPFQWTGLLPLLELQLRSDDPYWTTTVAELLADGLHPLPDAITDALRAANRDPSSGGARAYAWRAVDLSRGLGLL